MPLQDKASLVEELKKLSSFMNSATDTFICFDSKLNLVDINTTGLKRWKRKKKDLVGRNLLDLMPHLKKTDRYAKYMEVIKTGKSFFVDEIAHPLRKDTYVNIKAFKVGCGLGMIVTDVSDLMKTEKALRFSEERYRMVIEKMNEGIVMMDEKGIIAYVNQKFLMVLGLTRGEVIDHHFFDFADEASLKTVKKQFTRRKKGESQPYELLWTKKDGQKIHLLINPEPIFDFHGNFKGSFSIITDITRRRKIEEELNKSQELSRNLSLHLQSIKEEESKRIAREIHDELAQVLSVLKMDLVWISLSIPKDHIAYKSLSRKIESMSNLIGETIRLVKRISSEIRPVVLDDLGLVSAIEWQAKEFEKRTKIRCTTDIECDDIDLDPDRSTVIFRILQEALTNVMRHAEATKVRVRLKSKYRGRRLDLRVKDNGRGIIEEEIFSTKSFGLMGMRERIHPFNGKLKIVANRDKGTTLSVSLPLPPIPVSPVVSGSPNPRFPDSPSPSVPDSPSPRSSDSPSPRSSDSPSPRSSDSALPRRSKKK